MGKEEFYEEKEKNHSCFIITFMLERRGAFLLNVYV